MSEKNYQESTR